MYWLHLMPIQESGDDIGLYRTYEPSSTCLATLLSACVHQQHIVARHTDFSGYYKYRHAQYLTRVNVQMDYILYRDDEGMDSVRMLSHSVGFDGGICRLDYQYVIF